MTYTVTKIAPGRWALLSPYGDQLNLYRTCSGAKSAGALLAGWRGKVVVV